MNIAIYTRKSKATDHSESIDTQIKFCKDYFGDSNNNYYEIFEDDGFSGKDINRPAFERLLQEVEFKRFDIVAVYKIDRIARNVFDFVSIYRKLETMSVSLVSVTEGFDPSTPMGRVTMMLLASFADMERLNITQRVKDNMLQLAKKGCYTGGNIPQGSIVEKNNGKSFLRIVDSELINLYFNTYLDKGSLFLSYKYLIGLGVKISREGYRKVLRNPFYAKSNESINTYLKHKGYTVINSPDNISGYMTYGKSNKSPIAVTGFHEAVVESDTWLKVQKRLDDRKNIYKNPSSVNWLSSRLTCCICGSNYTLVRANGVSYYACKNRVRRTSIGVDKSKIPCSNKRYIRSEIMESKVGFIMEMLENDKFYKDTFHSDFNTNTNYSILESTIEKNTVLISNLVDKLSLISNDAASHVVEKIELLNLENSKLKSKLEIEKLTKLKLKSKKISDAERLLKISKFNTISSPEIKRRILEELFDSIEYNPYEDTIRLH